MTQRPTVLAIGGTNPTGLAGLSTDIRTIDALGAHPASVVTATTAQNNSGVSAIAPVPDSHLRAQLEAVDKHSIGAVKTGLFARVSQISIVADFIRQTRLPLVLDPVLSSSSGTAFLSERGQHALRETLLPLASVVTPNLPEAGALLGVDPPGSVPAMMEAAAPWNRAPR